MICTQLGGAHKMNMFEAKTLQTVQLKQLTKKVILKQYTVQPTAWTNTIE